MVEYYNLTKFSDSTGVMSFFKILSELTHDFFGYFIIAIVFGIPLIVMINRGKDVNSSIHICSLYTSILSILLYVTGVVNNSLIIWLMALVYIVTLVVRWSNKI